MATYEKPDALVWAHSISHRQAAEFEGCPCGCGDFCFAAAISPTLVLDWSEKDGESNGLQSGVISGERHSSSDAGVDAVVQAGRPALH